MKTPYCDGTTHVIFEPMDFKENTHARTGIFMIDASKGFIKGGNKNRLCTQDIRRIVDVFNKQTEAPSYARMVPVAETASPANDYNLNIPRYIDSSESEDLLARFASIQTALEGEVQQLTQQLAGRIKDLEDRYAKPLPELERDVDALSAKVEAHLKKMGLSL